MSSHPVLTPLIPEGGIVDEDELRVLGEPHDAPDDVWEGAVGEALSRPLDESLADFLTWDDNPGLDDGLDTGWDDPAYGTEPWDDGGVDPAAVHDPSAGLDGGWFEGSGHDAPLDQEGDALDTQHHDDPFGHDLLADDSLGHDGTPDGSGHGLDAWFGPEDGFDTN